MAVERIWTIKGSKNGISDVRVEMLDNVNAHPFTPDKKLLHIENVGRDAGAVMDIDQIDDLIDVLQEMKSIYMTTNWNEV